MGRTLLAGGLAGIADWLVAMPTDVLKSRLQTGAVVSCLVGLDGSAAAEHNILVLYMLYS